MSIAIEPVPRPSAPALASPATNPYPVYLARLAPGSRRTMSCALGVIADLLTDGRVGPQDLPWPALRYQHTQAVRAALVERYAPSNVNKHLAALRGVLREAWRLGQMNAEDYHRAVDLPGVQGERLPRGRALSQAELLRVFEACRMDPRPAGARDEALLAILYGAGLRRSEAVTLDMADYNAEDGSLRVRSGKGDKDRLVYLARGGSQAIERWLEIRGRVPGPLLMPVTKGGRVEQRRMTDQAVLAILQRRAKQAGVDEFSPHDLRRSFISHLLDAGADISAVQQLAGHASVTTTARYDRRGEAAKRKAVGLLTMPR